MLFSFIYRQSLFFEAEHQNSYSGAIAEITDPRTEHGSLSAGDSIVPIVFSGPTIKKDSNAGTARVVDVAPTLADLLGFSIAKKDGVVLDVKAPPPDSTPPSIFNTYASPAAPSAYQAIDVYSDVTDTSGVAYAYAFYSIDGTNWNVIPMTRWSGSTYKTSSPIPGQPSGTTIQYKIRASDKAGNNAESSVYQVVVGCTGTQAPPAPTLYDPGATNYEGSYTISWSSVTDAGCSGLKHYELQESNSPYFNTISYNTTQTSYLIAGKGSGTYYYRVRAWDNANNYGSFSNVVDINVEIPPPSTPPPPQPSWSLVDDFASESGTAYREGQRWGDWTYDEVLDANNYVAAVASYEGQSSAAKFYWDSFSGGGYQAIRDKSVSWDFSYPANGKFTILSNNKGSYAEYVKLRFTDASNNNAQCEPYASRRSWEMLECYKSYFYTLDAGNSTFLPAGVKLSQLSAEEVRKLSNPGNTSNATFVVEAGFDWSKIRKAHIILQNSNENPGKRRELYLNDLSYEMIVYLKASKGVVSAGESFDLTLNVFVPYQPDSGAWIRFLINGSEASPVQFNPERYKTYSRTKSYSFTTPGNYTFAGRAEYWNFYPDNYFMDSNPLTVIVTDSVAPSVSISSPASGAVLSTSSVEVAWSGSDNTGISRYEIQLDTGGWINKGTATSHVFTSVVDGVHTVYVKAVDAGGNAAIDSRSFSVDATAPQAPSPVASPAGWTNQSSVTISWGEVYDSNGIARYEYQIDSTTGAWTSTGSATSFVTPAQATGAHMAYVRAVDTVGNAGSIGSVNFYIDTSLPTAPVLNENHTGSNWSAHSSPNFYWSGDDEGSGVAYYAASLDGAELNLGSAMDYHPTLGDGIHAFRVYAVDGVGQRSEWSNEVVVSIDTSPPSGSVVINGGAAYTNSTYVTLALTYSDSLSGVAQVRYSNDGVFDTEAWEAPSAAKAWDLDAGDGTKTVYYQIKDNAGNAATFSNSIILDSLPPLIQSVIHAPEQPGISDVITINATISDATSVAATLYYFLDGTSWSSATMIASASQSASFVLLNANQPLSQLTQNKKEGLGIVGSDESLTQSFAQNKKNDEKDKGKGKKKLVIKQKKSKKVPKQDIERANGSEVKEIPRLGYKVVEAEDAENFKKEMKKRSDVEDVREAVQLSLLALPSDSRYAEQWNMRSINAEEAWNYTLGEGVVVAVLDTGVECTHADLKESCLQGYDFVNNDFDASDDNGHGTHVAGIIAANWNGLGVVGVAPQAKLLPLKVLDASGVGYDYEVAEAILGASDSRAEIISMSFGGDYSPIVEDAANYAHAKGALLVAAAGNNGNAVLYPAALGSVVAVAATNSDSTLASYSSRGAEVELAAPGGGDKSVLSTSLGNAYAGRIGTSMAAAHISGAAALAKAMHNLSGEELRSFLHYATLDLGAAGRDDFYGYGLINAGKIFGTNASGAGSSANASNASTSSASAIQAAKVYSASIGPFNAARIYYKIEARDALGNTAVEDNGGSNYVINIDNLPPIVTIHSPRNATYATTAVALNVSASESISAWNYSLNGAENVTFTPNTTITAVEGANSLAVWAVDTAGNLGTAAVYFTVDTTPPSIAFVFPTPANNSYVNASYAYVNVTLSENGSAILEWNGVNATMLGSGANFYYNKTGIGEGAHNFGVHASDAAGNGNATEVRRVIIDTIAPTIAIYSPANATYTTGEVNLNFSASDASGVAWLAYSLDGAANVTIAGNLTLTNLSDGQHGVVVYARDNAGNLGGTDVQFTVRLDSQPPVISLLAPTPLNGSRTTGNLVIINASAADEKSEVDAAVLEWNGVNESMIKLGEGRAVYFHAARNTTDGASYHFRIWVNDSFGNLGSSEERSFRENAKPAKPALVSPLNNSYTNTNYQLLSYASADEDGDALVYHVYGDANAATALIFNGTAQAYNWSQLADNVYYWRIAASDGYESSEESEIRAFTADTTKPEVQITSLSNGSYVRHSVAINASVVDANLERISVKIDGSEVSNALPYLWNTLNYSDGRHVIEIYAKDRASNVASEKVEVTIDNTPPSVSIATPANGSYIASTSITATWSGTDNFGVAGYELYLDGALIVSTNETQKTLMNLSEGLRSIKVVAFDFANNSASVSIQFMIDTTAPGITIAGAANGSYYNTDVFAIVTISDANLNASKVKLDGAPYESGAAISEEGYHLLEVTADDKAGNSASASLTFVIDKTQPNVGISTPLDGSYVRQVVVVSGAASDANLNKTSLSIDGSEVSTSLPYSWNTSRYSDGMHMLELKSSDRAGNYAAASITITVDNTPPSVSLSSPANGSYVRGTVDVVGLATDANLANAALKIDGSLVSTSLPYAWDTAKYTDGAHVIELFAFDNAGNSVSASASVVTDNTAPTIVAQYPARVADYEQFEVKTNVTEANLKNFTLLLNSVPIAYNVSGSEYVSQCLDPFVKGSVLNFGVIAEDSAGNAASKEFSVAAVEGEVKIEGEGKNEGVKVELEAGWKKGEAKGEFELQEKEKGKDEEKFKAHGKIDVIYKDCSGAFRISGTAKVEREGTKTKENVTFSGSVTEDKITIAIEGREFAIPAKVNIKEKIKKEERHE